MKASKNKIQTAFEIYTVIVPLIFFISFLKENFSNDLKPMMLGFLISFCYTVLFTIRYYGALTLYSIFLYTSAFFIYDCFFFTLFFGENFLLQTFPHRYYFAYNVGLIFVVACYLSVYVMHVSYCLFKKRKYKNVHLGTNVNLYKVGVFVMLCFFVPTLVKSIIQFNYIKAHGYTAIFTDQFSGISYPFWTAGSFIFFISGYCVFLASNPSKKKFLIYTFLCIIVYFSNALKGQRLAIVSVSIYCLYYYSRHFDIKIGMKKLVVFFCAALSLIILLGTVRNSYGSQKTSRTKIFLGDIVANVVYGQTTSRAVPMLIIKGELEYHRYPFFISPLLQPILGFVYSGNDGQTDLSAQKFNNISQVTMYNVSKSAHLKGCGYGGAFLAEAYDCFGLLGVLLFSVLLARFLVFIDFSRMKIRRVWIPFIFFALINVIGLARGRTFGMFMEWTKILFAYVLFFIGTDAKFFFRVHHDIWKKNI